MPVSYKITPETVLCFDLCWFNICFTKTFVDRYEDTLFLKR